MVTVGIEGKMDKLEEVMSDARQDQREEVIQMRKTLKSAMLKKNLKEHPALAQFLSVLRKREQGYTLILANKEDLTDVKRQGYFERRKEARFILSFFDSADRTIDGIDKALDYQLSDEVAKLSPDAGDN